MTLPITESMLVLEDGSVFEGEAIGYVPTNGVAAGEVVFNTTMTGYQEVITDPSYAGQIITFTTSHIGNYGATSPIKQYKSSVSVTDCRSGVCRPAYMWFNGYLAPTVVNAATRGVQGVPSDYTPYLAPINNTPGAPNYGNNNVAMTLANGSQATTGYSPGPSGVQPYNAMVLQGPKNFQTDISLYKEFEIGRAHV